MTSSERADRLEARVQHLSRAVVGLALLLVATAAWALLARPGTPAVLAVERLEIREPDGSLAFVLANSAHPAAATMDGQVIMTDQLEDRRHPAFIYFDGRGDEAGGLMLRTDENPDGSSVSRFLTFDGYKHQETVVLGHTENATGTASALRIIGHAPGSTLLGALDGIGLRPGFTRAELRAAIDAIPPAERDARMRALVGATRVVLGTTADADAALALHDGEGRLRVTLSVPAEGEPALRFLDADGDVVFRLPD